MNIDISIRAINHHTAGELEQAAMSSVFWELPCDATNTPTISEDPYFDKQIWIQQVLMQWGICGYTAYVGTGDEGDRLLPAATVFFAPGSYFPGAMVLPTQPVSPDAILISNVFVATPYMGLYLEHQLIDTVLTEAKRRGVKAVEAFARVEEQEQSEVDTQGQLSGDGGIGTGEYLYQPEAYGGWKEREQSHTGDLRTDILSTAPLLSEDILESEGFQVVCEHPLYPRYRYELKSTGSLFAHYAADEHSALNENAPLRTVLGGTKKKPQTIGAMSELKKILERHQELRDIAEREFGDSALEADALKSNVIESEH